VEFTLNRSSSIGRDATLTGMAYCAAIKQSSSVTLGGIKKSGKGQLYSLTGGTDSLLSVMYLDGLAAYTSYRVYCYAELSGTAIGNTLATVLSESVVVNTTCCRDISYTSGVELVSALAIVNATTVSSSNSFTYQLSSLPSDVVTLTPRVFSATGSDMAFSFQPSFANISSSSSLLSQTFVLTSLPTSVADDGGNFTVLLQISGPSKDEFSHYQSDSLLFWYASAFELTVTSIYADVTPPSLSTAVFSDDGTSVLVTFDSPTDVDGSYTTLWVCSDVFDFSGSNSSYCSWISTTVVRIDLLVVTEGLEDDSGLLEPGDTVTLKADTVRAACSSSSAVSYEGKCSKLNEASSVLVSSPASAVVPLVVLDSMPNKLQWCDNLTIDASASSGHGGRQWKSITWSVYSDSASVNTTALRDILSAHSSQYGTAYPVSFSGLSSANYSITLTLENFFGEYGSLSKYFEVVGTDRGSSQKITAVILGRLGSLSSHPRSWRCRHRRLFLSVPLVRSCHSHGRSTRLTARSQNTDEYLV
jgi:hypothetical protein